MAESEPLIADQLFVGATRPAMKWGVTYSAILANLVVTMELFLLTRNLLLLLVCVPIHALCVLACAGDARMFELLALWARTKAMAWAGPHRHGRTHSYGPLSAGRSSGAAVRAWVR
jgi:type IV secretion system protein VirB3